MDFIALDVETANSDLASICSVGLVHFRDGALLKAFSFLIDPEDSFDPVNISIHGIEPEHVLGKPTMREIFPMISSTLSSFVVAHHTPFDRVAFARAASKYGFEEFQFNWLDTARVARRAWERFSYAGYGLENLAREFNIEFRHHDACEDARAAGLILLRAMSETRMSLDQWLERAYLPLRDNPTNRMERSGNPDGPLAGETVVFTGQLSISRSDAADIAAAAGMDIADRVTKQTSVVVVGDQDVRRLGGHEKSAKHRRAEQLISEGEALRIIGESDFKVLVSIGLVQPPYPEKANSCLWARHDNRNEQEIIAVTQTPEASQISLLVDDVTVAKREGRFDDACKLLATEIERQEAESRRIGLGVAPWYYEQLAIIYRKQGRHADELAVLERYDRQIKAPGMTPAVLKARLEKVRPNN